MNKHGLSRYIPEDVGREVRRRSKFGCVICRCAFYQYEHIEPEFSEALEHDPDHICLLCGHCHDKVTRGVLSKETVQESYSCVQGSATVKPPFDEFDLNTHQITIVLGSCIFHGAKTLIKMNDQTALAIEPPEPGASFPTLSGFFADRNGNEVFRIDRNIWSGPSTAWDLEVRGREIAVRLAPGEAALKLRVNPPKEVIVELLDMRLGDGHLILRNDLLSVGRLSPDAEYYVGFERLECYGAQIGVCVDTKNPPKPQLQDISIVGGEGLVLTGTGVRVAVGSQRMTIRGLHIEDANRQRTVLLEYPLVENLQGRTTVLPPRI